MSMRHRRALRRQALAEAQRLTECTSCGRRFAGRGAYDQAHDARWPGGCLPLGAIESLLVQAAGGTWWTRGSQPR